MWIGSLISNDAAASLIVDGIWNGVGQRDQVPAADSVSVPVHRDSGGFGLSGARRADRRPHHGALRAARQELHPAAFGVRVRGAGDHGDAHHREQARPHRDHSDRAVHDLFGAAADLHAGDRGVHLRTARGIRCWRCWDCISLGFLAAIFTARLLKSTVLRSGRSSFMLEMPPYRWPTVRSLGCGWWIARRYFCAARAP